MALTDILAFVQGKLDDVAGMGLTHSYQPIATEPEHITAILGASGSLHFWTVRREATSETRATNRETERQHTLVIRGHMEVNDPSISEPVFQVLIEAVMLIFREEYRVGPAAAPTAELFGPMQLSQVGWKTLGQTALVHYCEGTLMAQELVRRTA